MWLSEAVVARIGAEFDGVVPARLAAKGGISPPALVRLRRRGVLVPLGRGVDRLRDHPVTWRSRCRAALELAGDDAVLGLGSAARLHGFYAFRHCDEVAVVTRRNCDHKLGTGRLLRTRWLPADHVTVVDGLPVTSVARTFFDLCANPAPGLQYGHPYHLEKMKRVYNDALGRRGMTFTQEAAVLLVLAKRGRRGTDLTRRILLHFGPKHRPTKSDSESLFFELVHAYGLPRPENQAIINGPQGFIGTVDFAWRSVRLIVEIDSSWHDGPLDEDIDIERDQRLKAAGYVVKRYRYGHLIGRPAAIARELGLIVFGNPESTSPDS